MKIFQIVQSGIITGLFWAMVLLFTGCEPVEPPRAAQEEMPVSGYQAGSGSGTDKTLDHNGEVSGNSDPARRE